MVWNRFGWERILAAIFALVFSMELLAAPGGLDISFGGGDGYVVTLIGNGSSKAYGVVQQSDTKLVVAGETWGSSNYDFAMARYNANGSLDSGFSGDGVDGVNAGAGNDGARSVIRQADGKLVAGGYSNNGSDDDFVVVRYKTDGSSDTAFSGDGISKAFSANNSEQGESVIQQTDGKLVIAGPSNAAGNIDFNVARFNVDGSIDTTFSGDGIQGDAIGSGDDIPCALIQQADGKLLLAGSSGNGTDNDIALLRLKPDGTSDGTFGIGSKVVTDIDGDDVAKSLIQQADGKLVVAGSSYNSVTGNSDILLVRYGLSGSLDSTFNGSGFVKTDIGSADNYAESIMQQSDGKLVVAGYSESGGDSTIFLVRYSGDGSLDGSFGNGGVVVMDITGGKDVATSIIQQQDGKLVVAGYHDSASVTGFLVARFESGQPDSDEDGIVDGLDTDDDNDSILDVSDNCSLTSNVSQTNTDGDAQGDACDIDDDNDGVLDGYDAFPLHASASVDTDLDGKPDSCVGACSGGLVLDDDDDNDGVLDVTDNCSLMVNVDQLNTDGDSQGDVCDPDDDNDGFLDAADNCSVIVNANQLNTDDDGQGDACDTDDDNDGVLDVTDNCSLMVNADQLNTDGDSQGDVCDPDDDNDGVVDLSDVFPIDPTESVDTDGDNLGDNSDPLPNEASTLNDFLNDVKADKAGSSVAFAGDFNKDGYGDYIIGIPGFDQSTQVKDAGRAEVISGKSGAVLASLNGTAAKDALGTAVAGGGDIDNDGFDDVVVGAPNAGATHAGSVTVLYGPNGARTGNISGTVAKSAFGTALALGDVNGDSRADILVGAPKDDDVTNGLVDAGSVTVYSGNGLGVLGMPFYGATAKANAGTSVASGDTNNDGNADIIIGAQNDGGVGSVKAYTLAGTPLLHKTGETVKAQFGKAVASGDVNGDGYADVLVGAPLDDDLANARKDAGSVTVFSGSNGALLTKKYGAVAKANLGNSVAAGDADGDGKADIIAGAWKDDKAALPKAIKDTGSVSVWSGADYSPITTLSGSVAKDYFGAAVSAGDINSDGKDDLIIGIPGFDVPGVPKAIKDAGKVTVLSGAGL